MTQTPWRQPVGAGKDPPATALEYFTISKEINTLETRMPPESILSTGWPGAPLIPNATVKWLTGKSLSANIYSFGTVPNGKKWFIPALSSGTQTSRYVNVSGGVGANCSLVVQRSGVTHYIMNGGAINAGQTAPLGPSVPFVLNAGNLLQFYSSAAGMFAHIAVYEFNADFPLKSSWIANPAAIQQTIYTVNRGKNAILLGLGVYDDTGSNRTLAVYVVPVTTIQAPGTVTCTKQAGGAATAGVYTVFVKAGDANGRTSATQGNTTVTTETTNLVVRAAFAQVTGATFYDVYCSTDGAASKFVGRVTEAQRASGIRITAQDTTTAGGTAGAVDVEIAGTGPAANTIGENIDLFDNQAGGTIVHDSGMAYPMNTVLPGGSSIVIEPSGALGGSNGVCWITYVEMIA